MLACMLLETWYLSEIEAKLLLLFLVLVSCQVDMRCQYRVVSILFTAVLNTRNESKILMLCQYLNHNFLLKRKRMSANEGGGARNRRGFFYFIASCMLYLSHVQTYRQPR
ncbi:hypothetical protein BCV72DRAFT_53054 [Rhizopus microsporus var. microsporus]|uniref:Uncharacterized protein n=1 Tax=Rhizopus microsporus var. microsporus TaxID=86635 RepID=A0A1X0QRM3_RHIZD|nr:hypothetical protein BCV72DRAFT_53054 [Rhizopus microsporus var. microsporus]